MDAWVDVDVGVTGLDGTAIHDIRDLAGVRFGFVNKVNLVKDKGLVVGKRAESLNMSATVTKIAKVGASKVHGKGRLA